MVFNVVPWLLSGSTRPQYALKQDATTVAFPFADDIDVFFWCLLAIISLRLAFNSLLSGAASKLAEKRGQDSAHRDGHKLLEEIWVLCGNIFMLSLAIFVMMRRNGGCWFGSTRECFVGWPNHEVAPIVALYYNLELAWYAHLLLKPVLRYGQPDGRDMMAHHFASLALLVASCGLNLTRIGVVVLTLFGISNPVLHAAKVCNQLHIAPLRIPAFALFALIFFITRVVLVPPVILVPAMLRSRDWVWYAVEDFHGAYVAFNVLLVVLYVLQLVWMLSIFRVLRQAATKGADAASKMSKEIDPSKRYDTTTMAVAAAAVVGEDAVVNGNSGMKRE